MSAPIEPAYQVRWYVMRAYKRQEATESALADERHGLNHFVPKRYVERTIRGEKKRILQPSIPGIFFVHASRHKIYAFKQFYPMMQYCYHRSHVGLDTPLVVSDPEMRSFMIIARQMEEDIAYHAPDEIHLSKGDRVRITGGVFEGVEGTLLRIKGKRTKRVVVKIEGVVAISSAEISPDFIEVIK